MKILLLYIKNIRQCRVIHTPHIAAQVLCLLITPYNTKTQQHNLPISIQPIEFFKLIITY